MKDIDPVIEIRAWRDEFARTHGYDIKRISAAMKAYEASLGDRLILIESPKAAPAPAEVPAGNVERSSSV